MKFKLWLENGQLEFPFAKKEPYDVKTEPMSTEKTPTKNLKLVSITNDYSNQKVVKIIIGHDTYEYFIPAFEGRDRLISQLSTNGAWSALNKIKKISSFYYKNGHPIE